MYIPLLIEWITIQVRTGTCREDPWFSSLGAIKEPIWEGAVSYVLVSQIQEFRTRWPFLIQISERCTHLINSTIYVTIGSADIWGYLYLRFNFSNRRWKRRTSFYWEKSIFVDTAVKFRCFFYEHIKFKWPFYPNPYSVTDENQGLMFTIRLQSNSSLLKFII